MNERTIFQQALDISEPTARQCFLNEACQGDAALRQRLEGLLQAHQLVSSFLEQPPLDMTSPFTPQASISMPTPTLASGSTFAGRFKLREKLGEGGMGTVYVTEQLEPVQRRVALKVIKVGRDSRQLLARFEQERQALALMDHPNIAKVYDAGVADGMPYFVMELIKGVPITKYCDDAKLTPKQRLELFVPVCQAVQHAHQKGIIHRDLKPSNILVGLYDGKPIPKVIDFGVAKATGPQLTDESIYTEVGSLIGTLEYMSPEQAELNNLDIDTRTDVYALGVILYELLTGSVPFSRKELEKAGFAEMLRIIKEVEPPKPSTKLSGSGTLRSIAAVRQTEPAKLTRLVRGELDWIVMKALEKDRTRRYEAANSLARDLEHYLHDEPVEACPPSTSYRLSKFAQKNKRMLATGAAFLIVLIGSTVIAAWLAVRALQAEQGALKLRDDAATAAVVAARDRDEARAANTQMYLAQDELRSTLYAARANLIQAAWNDRNVNRVHELLREQVPRPGEIDLRGFEWLYWQRRSHAELSAVAIPTRDPPVLSPDGTHVASISSVPAGHEIVLWDAVTGRQAIAFSFNLYGSPGGWWGRLRFSSDGNFLALRSGSYASPVRPREEAIRIWEAATGKEMMAIKGLAGRLADPTFTPDGKRLVAVLSDDNSRRKTFALKIWEIATGKEVLTIKDAAGEPSIPAVSPDGTRIAVVADATEASVQVWDASTGQAVLTIRRVPEGLLGVAFSPSGKEIVSTAWRDDSGDLFTWDAVTGKQTGQVAEPFPAIKGAAFSSDGGRLACFNTDGTVFIREAPTWRKRLTLVVGQKGFVPGGAFTPDGRHLVTVGIDGRVKTWNALASDLAVSLQGPHVGVDRMALSPDGTRVAAVGHVEKRTGAVDEVFVWDTTGRVVFSTERPIPDAPPRFIYRRNVAFSWNGHRLAYNTATSSQNGPRRRTEGGLKVWDLITNKEVFSRESFGRGFHGVAISPDGTNVAAVVGRAVKVWDVSSGKELMTLSGAEEDNCRLIYSRDGRLLAFAGGETLLEVRIWDTETRREVLTWRGPHEITGLTSLAFSPDGTRIAIAPLKHGQPGQVSLVHVDSGKELLSLKGHTGLIQSVAFSPDGKRIVSTEGISAGSARSAKLWDAVTGSELSILTGQVGWGLTAVFSADGMRVYSAGILDAGDGCELNVYDATPLAKDPRQ